MSTHDSHEKIFPADPRLTAYAFGELEGDELKLIEAAVAADPGLQAAVEELRAFGGELTTTLGNEPVTEKVDGDLRAPSPKKRGGRLIPFPLHYLATAAAACFAVVVWMRHERGGPAPGVPMGPDAAPAAVSARQGAASAGVEEVVPAPTVSPDMFAGHGDADTSVAVAAEAFRNDKLDVRAGAVAEEAANRAALAAPPAPVANRMTKAEFDLRLRVARTEAAVPVTSPVPDARVHLTAYPALQMPEMPELPSAGAGSLGGMESGRDGFDQGTLGAGTGAFEKSPGEARARGFMTLGFLPAQGRPPFDYARGESYAHPGDNVYRSAAADPLSTFSIDVDTASYANVRRFLARGVPPPRDAVRVEELVNYFPYRYAPPAGEAPFAANLAVASAPWAPAHRLVRIGIKGRELTAATRPAANLVFLLDVSGSMSSPNKLPLVKESLRLLVERLRPDDRVAIVTYAGGSGLALPSTPASRKREILAALDSLNASGSTNGAMGIHLAYDIARANFAGNGGINRVILCTDGDFNVGVTDRAELVRLIEEKAAHRVFLSVFGFGMGNYKDATLEALSARGNGAYGYIDNRREAEKVFVEQVEGTLATIAKDVKIQVEFNPERVQSYRLIGYENRLLAKEDFNNDAVDAGDIGAGHTVTALYEIVPVGADAAGTARPGVDPLKYQKSPSRPAPRPAPSGELLTMKIRYKAPEGDVSAKQEFPLVDGGRRFEQTDGEFQFAAAVAAWGMLLRDSPHKGSATFEDVLGWAENGLGDDAAGYRAEFVELVRKSAELAR